MTLPLRYHSLLSELDALWRQTLGVAHSPQPENAVIPRLIILQSLSENKHQNFAIFFQNSLDIDLLACYNKTINNYY